MKTRLLPLLASFSLLCASASAADTPTIKPTAANIPYGDPANPQSDILEGDQCLVLFLQGPPGLGGFSKNPLNPLENPPPPAPPRMRYYEFPAIRLINRQTATYPRALRRRAAL